MQEEATPGVVMRMSGGSRSIAARSFCGDVAWSPVRTATRSSEREAGEGEAAEVPLDVVVERLERRDVENAEFPVPFGSAVSRSMAERNVAASVLAREPVGAWMEDGTWPPAAIAGQPFSCAGVGAAKFRSNQSRVSGRKSDSGSMDRA